MVINSINIIVLYTSEFIIIIYSSQTTATKLPVNLCQIFVDIQHSASLYHGMKARVIL
jgi:hypothetical protein